MAAAGWSAVATASHAADSVETAWWWQAESQTGAVPPPPTVPEGGLWVSSNPSGPQAISAIRIPIGEGATTPRLTLTIHQAAPPNGVAVVAYPTSSPWTAGPAQAWSSKPAYDPSGLGAEGALSADGKAIDFDLSALVDGPELDIVLAPASTAATPAAPLPVSPTFDVTFEQPGSGVQGAEASPPGPVEDSDVAAGTPPSTPLDLGVGSESITPALPAGLVGPPSATVSLPAGQTAAPPVALRSPSRRIQPAVARRSLTDSAAIAAMLAVVLVWLARDSGMGLNPSRKRRFDG
jgi:hypothetical protein